MQRSTTSPTHPQRDRGAVLPLVLVFMVAVSIVSIAVATYTTTGLRYGQVVEGRADRLAAADGGLRYAVQKLSKVGHHECPRIDPPDVNGAIVTLTCMPVGSGFDDTAGYALILTGEELPAGSPLMTAAGGTSQPKRIGGLVYMNRLKFGLQSPIRFENGQLQYSSPTGCPTTPTIDNSHGTGYLEFAADHYGIVCTTQPWSRAASPTDNPATPDINEQGKYSEPLIPATLPTNLNPASSPSGTCTVFQPGYYTTPPVLGAYNYFRSGNYVFDGFTLSVSAAKVTAGKVLGGNGGTQAIPNTACDVAKQNDNISNVTEQGVTFYMKNGARFEVRQNGTLEILRRKQGRSYVSVHVLDDAMTYNDDIILQGPGSNKDMAIHGMVWAPQARVTLDRVANIAEAQMLGGAVISNVNIETAANTSGFVIGVEPSDITGLLQLDSTAVSPSGASTTIRSIVDYRPSTKYAAATSWRVIE